MDIGIPAESLRICRESIGSVELNGQRIVRSFSQPFCAEPAAVAASISPSDAVIMAQTILATLVTMARDFDPAARVSLTSSLRRAADERELGQAVERSFRSACAGSILSVDRSAVPDAWAGLLRYLLAGIGNRQD
ncbi:hypothetical protein [Sphingomonas sp. R86521]|uniref:hypothetical protein n=1 Tax=Sphingomonas sp. R86521 TaxID=3093860 RepID=UPI0036D24AA4